MGPGIKTKDRIRKKHMNATKPQKTSSAANREPDQEERWELRLYVAGGTPKSVAAFVNL